MPKFLDYNPEQVYLLPPSVRDVLGENHVCFFLHRAIEALELSAFEQGYADDGRPAANASPNRVETIDALRAERARIRQQIRRWQRQCDSDDPHEAAGQQLAPEHIAAFQQRLQEIPRRLEQLRKAGRTRASLTDPDSRFLRDRRGFTLGYTVTVAVSEDHLIVEQRVTQAPTDNAALVPTVEAIEQRCGERPPQVSADSGFFTLSGVVELAQRGIDAYVPDSTLARELNRGPRVRGGAPVCHPVHRRMRQKLRSPPDDAPGGRPERLRARVVPDSV